MDRACPVPAALVLPLRRGDMQWVPCVDAGTAVAPAQPLAVAFGRGAALRAPAAAVVHAIEARPAGPGTVLCIVLTPTAHDDAQVRATIAIHDRAGMQRWSVVCGTPLRDLLSAADADPYVVLSGDAVHGEVVPDRSVPLLDDGMLHLLDAGAFDALPAWLACRCCDAAWPWTSGPLPHACPACAADAVCPGPAPALDALRTERAGRDADALRLMRADAARMRHRHRNARLAAAAAARAERIVSGAAGGGDAVQAALARARARRDGAAR